jgi:hypothetical protein
MAVTFDTKYPAELTDAAWQKKKSFLDKAKANTKTGLGVLLEDAEKKWALINFNLLIEKKTQPDVANMLKSAKDRRATAQQHLDGPVNSAYLALMKASRKAFDTSKNKALSKTAIAAAQTLSNKLQQQAVKLKGIKLADFDKQITDLQQAADSQTPIHEQGVAKVKTALKALASNPTADGWDKANMLNSTSFVRSHALSAVQVGRPDFKAIQPTWKNIVDRTVKINNEISAMDPEAAKKTIAKYVKDVTDMIDAAKL